MRAGPAVVERSGCGRVPRPVGLVPQLPAADVRRRRGREAVLDHLPDLLLPVAPALPPVGERRVDVRHADELLRAGAGDVVRDVERVAARLRGAVAQVGGARRGLREPVGAQGQELVGGGLRVRADAVQAARPDVRHRPDDGADVDRERVAGGLRRAGGRDQRDAQDEGEDAGAGQGAFHGISSLRLRVTSAAEVANRFDVPSATTLVSNAVRRKSPKYSILRSPDLCG